MEPTTPNSTPKNVSGEVEKAAGKAQTAMETASSKAKSALDDASDSTKSVVDAAEEKAKKVTEDLADRARDTATRTAESVSGAVNTASETLREAAENLRDGTFQERTFGQMTKSLADISDAIQNKDFNELTHDVTNFARRHPVVFVGGLALLGFAAARMMSDSDHYDHHDLHDVHDLDRNLRS